MLVVSVFVIETFFSFASDSVQGRLRGICVRMSLTWSFSSYFAPVTG